MAICDELGITAQGLTTLFRKNRRQDMEQIGRFVDTYGVDRIVVGYPLRLDGTVGIQCEKVDRFVRQLESAFALPVIKWDESMTSKEAEEMLSQAKVRPEKKRQLIDRLAASLILQSYLDSLDPAKKSH